MGMKSKKRREGGKSGGREERGHLRADAAISGGTKVARGQMFHVSSAAATTVLLLVSTKEE